MNISTDGTTPHEFTGCPECGAPGEVIDRFVLQSSNGPLAHATVACAARRQHRFTVLVENPVSAPPASRTGEEPGTWTFATRWN